MEHTRSISRGRGRVRGRGRRPFGASSDPTHGIALSTTPSPTSTPSFVPAPPEDQAPLTEELLNESAPHESESSRHGSSSRPPVEVDETGRIILRVEGHKDSTGYVPSKEGTNPIGTIIKNKLEHPWSCWSEVPNDVKLMWFEQWKKYVVWAPELNAHMRRAFNEKGAHKLRDMLYDVRVKKRRRPVWMSESVYAALCEYWRSDKFKKLSELGKKNRESENGGSLWAGGQISQGTHAARLAKEKGRPVTPFEVFEHTRRRKSNKEWVDQRSKETAEKYIALSQAETQACTQEDQTGAPSRQKTPAELMAEAVGGRNKKGRFYGMSQHIDAPTSFSVTGPSAAQGSSAMETKVDYLMNAVGSLQQTLDKLLQHQTSLQPHGPPPVQPSGSGIHPVPQFNSADGQNGDDEYEDYSQ